MNKRILLPLCRPVYSTAQDKECLFSSCPVQEVFGEVCDTPVEPKRLSMFRIRRDSDVVGIFKRKNAFPAFQ